MPWRLIAAAYAVAIALLIVAARSIDGPGAMLASLAVLALTLPWSSPIFVLFSWTLGHNGAGDFWLPLALGGLLNAYAIAAAEGLLRTIAEERRTADTAAIALWRAGVREAIRHRRVLAAMLAVAVVLIVPITRTLFPAWTVRIVNVHEQPVAGVWVARSWTHRASGEEVDVYSQQPDNFRMTDRTGTVSFPAERRTFSVGWWLFASSVQVGDSGVLPRVSGSLSIMRANGEIDLDEARPALRGPGFCENEKCLNGPLETTLLVTNIR